MKIMLTMIRIKNNDNSSSSNQGRARLMQHPGAGGPEAPAWIGTAPARRAILQRRDADPIAPRQETIARDSLPSEVLFRLLQGDVRDERGDEIELGDRDQTPVDPADRDEHGGEDVELLHRSSL